MSKWKRTPFEQLIEDSKDGEWGEGREGVGLREATIIRGTDFVELDNPDADFPKRWIKEQIVERKSLRPGDIILETAGGTSTQSTGRSALLKASFFRDRSDTPVLCASFSRYLRLERAKYSPRFVYYLLQTLYRSGYMAVFNIQHTGVSRFQYTAFRNHTELRIPELSVQQRIAAVLSAYDELIENNRRRISLLERVAEEIYREWFVRLRYPGHDSMESIRGLPKDWQALPFSEIVDVNPAERVHKSEDVPFAGMEDLSLNSMFFAFKETRRGAQGAKFRNNDVLFPRITPSVENGKRGFVMTLAAGQVGLGSTEFIVFREKVIGPEHIYFLSCSDGFRRHAELSMTGASGRQRVQEECFSFFLVKTPPPEIRHRFAEVVRPHFSQIHQLSIQIALLATTRDLLLPRLMSGRISLDNSNVKYPAGMADELDTGTRLTAYA